jgi:uncharacterized flavoprotein (TIGR03862 family)
MKIAVVGGGPAGLRAAEVAGGAVHTVTVYDARPSVGRKFLVAGCGGLNLTHGEPLESFALRYLGTGMPPDLWQSLLADFSPQALQAWAHSFGIETFQAKTGRIYPVGMKAAPMLRSWVSRLKRRGVRFEVEHRLTGLCVSSGAITLQLLNRMEPVERGYDAVVLALGGGSWPQTGSDGQWTTLLTNAGISIAPLAPANCGWECEWHPGVLNAAEGLPIKNIQASAGALHVNGELLITRYGLEGGCIYQLGHVLRQMSHPAITIDFKPTFSVDELVQKSPTRGPDVLKGAVSAWKLSPAAAAVLRLFAHSQSCGDIRALATLAKHCVIPLIRPRPLAEAISSAGGVCWSEVDASLMLKKLPGVFVAGEMLDWEAPTGGYLIQGCLATGTRAGAGAATWIDKTSDPVYPRSNV